MMELEDMHGMSPIGRISRLRTSVLKRVRAILRSSKYAPKTGPSKICVDDVFMREVAFSGKRTPSVTHPKKLDP